MIPKQLIKQLKHTFESAPDGVYIKDENFRYHYMNQTGLNRLQLQEDDLYLLADEDLYLSQYAPIYNKHDLMAMQEQISYQLDDVYTKNGEKLFSLSYKLPLKDAEEKIHGVLCFSKYMNYKEVITTLSSKNQFNSHNLTITIDVDNLINTILELTKREMEVLYYFLHGKSVKSSAQFLNISERTIVFHLNNIKIKWNCFNKEDIFNKALDKGLIGFSGLWNILL